MVKPATNPSTPVGSEREFRNRAAGVIMKSLVKHNLSSSLPITAPDGSHPIDVALEDELVSAVVARSRRSDGFANVFVALEDERMVLVALKPASTDRLEASSSAPVADVHNDITMSFFVACLREQPQNELSFRIRFADTMSDVPEVREMAY